MITTDLASEADRLTAAHKAGDPTASEHLAALLGLWWRENRAGLIAELRRRADGAELISDHPAITTVAGQDPRTSESDTRMPKTPKRPAIDRSDAASCSCGARWTGTSKCHCSACHRLFSSVSMFDRHRVNGRCVDPATDTIKPRNGGPERPAYILREGVWCSSAQFTSRVGELFGGAA